MRAPAPSYHRVFALAVRLLRGDELLLVDKHGRRWRSTATELLWVTGQGEAPVLEGSAADVAIEVVSRGLRQR